MRSSKSSTVVPWARYVTTSQSKSVDSRGTRQGAANTCDRGYLEHVTSEPYDTMIIHNFSVKTTGCSIAPWPCHHAVQAFTQQLTSMLLCTDQQSAIEAADCIFAALLPTINLAPLNRLSLPPSGGPQKTVSMAIMTTAPPADKNEAREVHAIGGISLGKIRMSLWLSLCFEI